MHLAIYFDYFSFGFLSLSIWAWIDIWLLCTERRVDYEGEKGRKEKGTVIEFFGFLLYFYFIFVGDDSKEMINGEAPGCFMKEMLFILHWLCGAWFIIYLFGFWGTYLKSYYGLGWLLFFRLLCSAIAFLLNGLGSLCHFNVCWVLSVSLLLLMFVHLNCWAWGKEEKKDSFWVSKRIKLGWCGCFLLLS